MFREKVYFIDDFISCIIFLSHKTKNTPYVWPHVVNIMFMYQQFGSRCTMFSVSL